MCVRSRKLHMVPYELVPQSDCDGQTQFMISKSWATSKFFDHQKRTQLSWLHPNLANSNLLLISVENKATNGPGPQRTGWLRYKTALWLWWALGFAPAYLTCKNILFARLSLPYTPPPLRSWTLGRVKVPKYGYIGQYIFHICIAVSSTKSTQLNFCPCRA